MAIGTLRLLSLLLLLLFPQSIFSASTEQRHGNRSPRPSSGGSPSYARFTFDASVFPPQAEYDYIIVGGGTAGCPLAATLSAGGHRVLILERGGTPDEFPSVGTLDGFLTMLTNGDAPDNPAQSFTSEDGVANARGRVLGGSSAINAGFYTRAHPEFFNETGGVEWDLVQVERAYEWVERVVAFRPHLGSWQSAVRDGLLQAKVTPYNGYTVRHLEGTKIGASTFDSRGRRHTAADLLRFANPNNLRVASRATVHRILLNSMVPSTGTLEQRFAIGVTYTDHLGQFHRAMTRPGGEVILSSGALGSPQLLLLSGIGPSDYLTSKGIPVEVDLPDVGKYLYDNPRNGITIIPNAPVEHSLIQVVGITNGTFIEASSNVISFRPRLTPSSTIHLPVATIIEKIAGPKSVGSLRLKSLNVRDTPIVRFNYFSTKEDLDRCVSAVRKIAAVLDGRSMEKFKMSMRRWFGGSTRQFRFVGVELPQNRMDDEAMGEYCKRTVSTIWHYHGGCLVGKVLDGEYRVAGVGGLRVVDGSTFPVSPGTNPQATVMMMGRYMGLKINQDRRKMSYAPISTPMLPHGLRPGTST